MEQYRWGNPLCRLVLLVTVLACLASACTPHGKAFRPVDIGGWSSIGLKTAHGVKYDPEGGVTVQIEWGWALVDEEGQCLQPLHIKWANFNLGTRVVGGPRRELLPADTQWLGAHAKWGYYGPCSSAPPKAPQVASPPGLVVSAPVEIPDVPAGTEPTPAPAVVVEEPVESITPPVENGNEGGGVAEDE